MCAERERDALDDVGLATHPGAEAHRGRDVEQQPRGDGSLCDVDPHVELVLACRRVPVDAPDVVADDIRADLGELRAASEPRGAVVAVDEPGRPAREAEVERPQEVCRHGARPRLGSRARGLGKRERHAARSTTSSVGAGTAASAASTIESSRTPVAIAS